jgi:hypothetical protein
MKRMALLGIVSCLCACALPGTGRAGSITYTEQFLGFGKLDGQTFVNELVTISGSGDTLKIGGVPPFLQNQLGTVTVHVNQVGTDTLVDPFVVFANQATQIAGFTDTSMGIDIMNTSAPDFATYDLTTPIGPVSGPPALNVFDPFATTSGGTFQLFQPGTLSSSFTATLTAVPEPASLTLLGVVGVAVYGWRRRR